MKRFIFILCTAGLLAACNTNNPEPEELNEVQKAGRELAKFLTENYTKGDSVYLTTESGVKEGFVIDENYYSEHRIDSEVDGLLPDVRSCIAVTELRSKNNLLKILLKVGTLQDGLYKSGIVYIRGLNGGSGTLTQSDSEVRIETEDGRLCILQKNKGIVSISTKDGKSWKL